MINRQILKSNYVRDSFRYYLARIIPGLIGILVIPGILRLYGESVYGEYSLCITVVQIIGAFFSTWLGRSFMRYYTDQHNQHAFHNRYNRTAYLALIPAAVLSLALLAGMRFHYSTILLAILISLSLTSYSYTSLKFQTFLKSDSVLYAEVVRSTLFFGLAIGVYYVFDHLTGQRINLILMANLVAFLAGNLLFYFFAENKRKIKEFARIKDPELNRRVRHQLMQYGLPLAAWMIGAFVLNLSDRYILKIYYDFDTVGIYSSVYDTIYKLNTFLFTPLITTIQPRLIKCYNEGDLLMSKKILRRTLIFEILLLLVVFLFFLVVRKIMIREYLGIDSGTAIDLVFPLLFGTFFWNLSNLLQKPLELTQKTKVMFWGIIIVLGLNVVLNFILIPQYGMIAAAYTTLVSTMGYLLFVSVLSRNKI